MSNIFEVNTKNLEDLFSAPISAVINADAQLSKTIADFICKYGFEGGDCMSNNIGKLKMVSFSYNNNGEKFEIKVPALSLFQLPLLRIESANFDMQVKLFTIGIEEQNDNVIQNTDWSKISLNSLHEYRAKQQNSNNTKTVIKASLAPTINNQSLQHGMQSNMNVKLNMGQSDMPAGLINLQALLGNLNETSANPDIQLTFSPENPIINVSNLAKSINDQGNEIFFFSKTIMLTCLNAQELPIADKAIVLAMDQSNIGVTFMYPEGENKYFEFTNDFGKSIFTIKGFINPNNYQEGTCLFKFYMKDNSNIFSLGQLIFQGNLPK